MFSGTWKLKPESDGSYFIDRDGTSFRYILNYIRNGELTIPEDDTFLVKELLKEAEFYQIQPLIQELKNIIYPPIPPVDSVLLTPEYSTIPPVNSALLTKEYSTLFRTWLGGQYQWNLLYRVNLQYKT